MTRRTQERYHRLEIKQVSPYLKQSSKNLAIRYAGGFKIPVQYDADAMKLYLKGVSIGITATACHYGGLRYWFICNHCKKRKGVMYIIPTNHGNVWTCRTCANLVYKSQQLTKTDYWTWFIKAGKVAQEIEPDYNVIEKRPASQGLHWYHFPDKPKHMKHRKYEKLREQFIKYADKGNKINTNRIQNKINTIRKKLEN